MNQPPEEIVIYWFRRDLRLHDNCALYHALRCGLKVLPVFIFDEEILGELPKDDARVSFIYQALSQIHRKLLRCNSSLLIKQGKVSTVWEALFAKYRVKKIYFNHDYEPYARERDHKVTQLCSNHGVAVHSFKDQVIFEKAEILKPDGLPYKVYTPYKNKWRQTYLNQPVISFASEKHLCQLLNVSFSFPSLEEIGFTKSSIQVPLINKQVIPNYECTRNLPELSTSHASVYLRFGLIGIRQWFSASQTLSTVYTNQLIWREFFMQILFHFPRVTTQCFRNKYREIPYRNHPEEFEAWCQGKTGYALVDAGMRQLNATGFMHNRVRMVTASFLCKHLLIDWRWGEAYFAKKLLDYDLAANNGNWQWVAGTGCDAAPYFRVFNPMAQQQKFDPDKTYINQWLSDETGSSIPEIVPHKLARDRYLQLMNNALRSL